MYVIFIYYVSSQIIKICSILEAFVSSLYMPIKILPCILVDRREYITS
jgi:hypothetical protein